MSELAHYSFLPWLRQGLATRIVEKDTLGESSSGLDKAVERAKLKIDITVQDTGIEEDDLNDTIISKQVQVIGPGDIIGLSERAIVQTNPRRHINNFEANSLVYIDFYEEDFAWRYTPANPNTINVNAGRRLRPWLVLLVLKEEEFELQKNQEALPTLILNDNALNDVFPPHKETWAWAHVQINHELVNNDGNGLVNEVNTTLEKDPDMGISRLMSPRKLNKSTAYTAFLLPAFETGRLAGLGESIQGIKAQEPSWQTNADGTVGLSETRNRNFPVYYQWSFHTGAFGDFESLVSVLEPIVMENDSGKIPMDIQSAGFGLDGKASTKILGMEGALKPPEAIPDAWPTEVGDNNFINGLQKILNFSEDVSEETPPTTGLKVNPFYNVSTHDDPILVPPTYGLHHAMIKKLGPAGNPDWIESLNGNPTLRATAGLGTKTIQDKQEDLMHRAWQQIGEINDANQKIREAELAKMASRSLFNKHILSATLNNGIYRTAAFHQRILNATSTRTVQTDFSESRIPIAAKSAAFKRITRPGKKGIKNINKLSKDGMNLQRDLLLNFNIENGSNVAIAVMAATPKAIPENALSIDNVNDVVAEALSAYKADDNNMAQETFFRTISSANLDNLELPALKIALSTSLNALTNEKPSTNVINIVEGLISDIHTFEKNVDNSGFMEVLLKAEKYKEIFGPNSNIKFYDNVKVTYELEADEKERPASATSSKDIKSFQDTLNDLSGKTELLKSPKPLPVLDRLDNVYKNVVEKINPLFTIERKITSQIKVWDGNKLVALPKLKPIMAHPEFPEPVYEYLGKISQNFILPNIEQLPNNSLTLLASNQHFIEAYMAGLNHEMARELVWREFPTDKRGTYFRQFWNIKDNVLAEEGKSQLDIKKMHTWDGKLGEHSAKEKPANLVLVVRGELLDKYPNTMVYAQRATYNKNKPSEARDLPETITAENTRFPIFSAELEPDIMLFGFDLDKEEAKGLRIDDDATSIAGKNPGWFFVFKERPGQITFGLDEFTDDVGNEVMPGENGTATNPESWNDLAWEHLVAQPEALEEFQISMEKNITVVDPVDGNPHPVWGSNSADLASILYQNPVIFARHAAEMLP